MSIRFILSALFCVFLISACSKDDCQPDGIVSLEEYARLNNLKVEQGDGYTYVIEKAGADERPTLQDSVLVNYRGFLTNEQVFDQTTSGPRKFPLAGLISGWQRGIPLIGRGGKIKLLLPSELAYGNRQVGSICPNSDLVFDIELVGFNR